MMKKLLTPTYKEIEKNWPDGVDFSQRRVRMIKKLLNEKKPAWINYNTKTDFLRLFIRDTFLKFEPNPQEFSCETVDENSLAFAVGFNRYKIPLKTPPKGNGVDFCVGGFRNVRKLILED